MSIFILNISQGSFCLAPPAGMFPLMNESSRVTIISNAQTFGLDNTLDSTIDLQDRLEFVDNLSAFATLSLLSFSLKNDLNLPFDVTFQTIETPDEKVLGEETLVDEQGKEIKLGVFEDYPIRLAVMSYLFSGELLTKDELKSYIENADQESKFAIKHGCQILFHIVALTKKNNGIFTFQQLWEAFQKYFVEAQQILDNLSISATVTMKDGSTVKLGPDDVIKPTMEAIADYFTIPFNRALNLALGNIVIKSKGEEGHALITQGIETEEIDRQRELSKIAAVVQSLPKYLSYLKINELFQSDHFKTPQLYRHIVDGLDLHKKTGAEIGTGVCTFECEALVNAGMEKMFMVDNVRNKLPKRADLPDKRIVPKYGDANKLPFKDASLDFVYFDGSLSEIALQLKFFQPEKPIVGSSLFATAGPEEFKKGIQKPLEEARRVLKKEGNLVILFEYAAGFENTQLMIEILLNTIESFGFQIEWIVKNNKLGFRGPVLISVKKISPGKAGKLLAKENTTREITSAK